MRTIQDAVWNYRRKFRTTFILKAAINNPNVIIVFRNKEEVKREESHYNELISKLNVIQKLSLKKINWKFFKNPLDYTFFKTQLKPLFISVSELEKIRGCNRALVFDNSCFA